MILNNIILIIVLLLLANYLSKGTIITIVLKYYEIFKKHIFLVPPEKDNIQDFHYDNETIEDSENTLKLNTLKITDSNSITIDDMNYTTWH